MATIEDFGEKLPGARKDAHVLKRRRAVRGAPTEDDWTRPLREVWPEPKYSTMQDAPVIIDWVRGLRDTLQDTSVRQWRDLWPLQAQFLKDLACFVLSRTWMQQEPTHEDVLLACQDQFNRHRARAMASRKLERWVPDAIEAAYARALLYARVGHRRSLRKYVPGRGTTPAGPQVGFGLKSSARTLRHWAPSWREAVERAVSNDEFLRALSSGETPAAPQATRPLRLSIVQDADGVAIATRHAGRWVRLFEFARKQDALEFARQPRLHAMARAQFEQWRAVARVRLRRDTNAARVGPAWREADVTPEVFLAIFGFRGVQFGNHVSGTRRQQNLNQAYDALMDLASTLDVAPRALSLDGTLGLAFGARGRGGARSANAHFEPQTRVINLTKAHGAGALAHEWFHAFDHHVLQVLSRAPRGRDGFFSQAVRASRTLGRDRARLTTSLNALERIFARLGPRSAAMDARSSRKYWASECEMAARAFETGVIEALASEGRRNDYLANVKTLDEITKGQAPKEAAASALAYPYPTVEQAQANAEDIFTAFQSLRALLPTMSESFV